MKEKFEDERPDEAYEQPLPWRRVSGFVARMVLRHPFLLTALIVAGLGVAASEVLSISLIFPFLETLGGGAVEVSSDMPLSFVTRFFEGLTTEEKIRAIAVALVGIQLVRGTMNYLSSRISSYLGILLERDLRQLVFDDLLRVDLGFINRERIANLFTILHTYPKQTADVAKQYLAGLSVALTFISYIVLLFAVSVELTLVAIVLGATSVLLVERLRTVLKRIARRINRSRVRLHQVSIESLSAMKVIRLFAREDHARGRFLGEVKTLQRNSFKKASVSSLAAPLQRTLNMALFAVLLITATFVLNKEGAAWLVLLTTFIYVVARLMAPLGQFTKRRASIAANIPSLEELVGFLDRTDKPYMEDGPVEFTQLREGIRFEEVALSYQKDAAPIVGPVSFEIPRGSTVALVGESGSGKSTIVNLLARLMDPTAGRVVVDGHDLREYRSGSWRSRVAVVSQETFLFNATVRDNIRYGRLDATDAEIEEAARQANAHDFILRMEDGYETSVGDRGVRLSGGQAQRIAIARALLADPEVLVLDEATSALDTATERIVQQALDTLSQSRTVVAIAHRLSTIRDADQILVLENGRIVEHGGHDELMARRGRYHAYVQMQDLTHDAALEDTPPRRVQLKGEAPSRPLSRVVLTRGSARASVRNGSGTHDDVPVVFAKDEADAQERLQATDGGLVVLRAGVDDAFVRIADQVHASVPLYCEGPDGREMRVRVRQAREAGSQG